MLSQVVVWDRIVERKEDAVLDMEAEFLDYPLRDPAMELRWVRGLGGCLVRRGGCEGRLVSDLPVNFVYMYTPLW